MDPGMANTSRPCSLARRAVISDPDAGAASTTSVPCARPEIMRLRLGKLAASGGVPRGYSLTSNPCAAIRRARSRCCLGYTRSNPVPTTAMVAGVVSCSVAAVRAPSCAAASMPSASPDTMVRPAPRKVLANCRAFSCPCGVGLRLPTMARQRICAETEGCRKRAGPIMYSINGGSSVWNSAGG